MSVRAWNAFSTGIARALRYWQVLLALYLFNLGAAMLLALLPALNMTGPAHFTSIHEAARGIPAWLLAELFSVGIMPGEAQPWAGPYDPLGLSLLLPLTTVAVPLVAWISGSALSGGLLLTYAEAPQPFTWRRFWWGCWRWLGAFLLLGLFQAVPSLLLLFLLLWAAAALITAAGAWTVWIALPLILLVLAFWLAASETARFLAIRRNTRNVFACFGRAFALTIRSPHTLGLFYLLSLLLLIALHALYRLGILPLLPLAFWPLALLVQQSFIILRLLARLARLAGVVELVQVSEAAANPLAPSS